ncbi:cation-translocating P-type ATPase [Promineifilum sp.]|uniref:cation-translocating P-type ATPase n=1 Tax=Promineifilum sp. TaxID=2664178 RepID=UPI0035B19517
MTIWHTQSVDEVLSELSVQPEAGLNEAEAGQRLATYGPNELIERGGKHPLRILWQQFTSTMVLILIAAAVVSGLLGKATETIAIAAIVVLFALLGFVQEYRAEQAMAALKKLAVPVVRVLRGGERRELSARELVPGDVILLEAGSAVPADVRLIESANLRIQEAVLTGESEAVEKETGALEQASLPLGDRINMGYMGTAVTYGRGTAVVVETGMSTELGKIASLIQDVDESSTPLQRRLDGVGKLLALVGVAVAGLVMLIGVLLREDPRDMFLTAVSVAVAVVPEGLPAVVTVTLALGAQRMLRRNSLIRKLPAVETLGAVTVICSDKTGTLTENRMTVTVIDVAGHYLELIGTAHPHPAPALSDNGAASIRLADQPPAIGLALAGGALCNDASLQPDPETGRYGVIGDPTEGALLVAALQAGVRREELLAVAPRVAEQPFDSERKRMTTVHRLPDDPAGLPEALAGLRAAGLRPGEQYVAFTKGAVDGMLDISRRIWVGGEPQPLDDHWREGLHRANEQMADNGMRVLGIGVQWIDAPDEELERDLTIIGLVGMIDPPRPEVKAAVATAKAAGIRPIMITGDHPLTARFIAYDLGISDNGRVKTGLMLDAMSPEELEQVVDDVSIYARVTPANKLEIVEMLQKKGHVVAMTGDGVNDSPALKRSDIGVAMGITGTDVSKEASDMVLLDDNFATIVAAVEEGRVIYDNIRRFVKFSIAGNVGKVLVMLLSPLLLGAGAAVALLPLQLLWLNLLTDGLLGLGLGVEPAERNTMRRPPRDPKAGLFSEGLGVHVLWVGVLIGAVALLTGWFYYDPANPDDTTWQTMLFTTLAFLQVGQALASRSSRESFFALGLRTNLTLLGLAVAVVALQLAVLYAPFLERFFLIVPLPARDLLLAMGLGSLAFWAIEIEKWLLRRRGGA